MTWLWGPAASTAQTLVINNATVIDGTGAPARRATVVVDGERIASVDTARYRPRAGVRVIDASGKYVIPGLWDMHGHVAELGQAGLGLFVANGVTGVRDMGGRLDELRALRRVLESDAIAPRVLSAGLIVESATWLRNVQRMIPDTDLPTLRLGVENAQDAARAADSIARLRFDFIKVRTVANRAAYEALLTAATERGLTVVGHAPAPQVSLADASDLGQKSIEHGGPPLAALQDRSAAERAALFEKFVRNGTWITPTLVPAPAWRARTEEEIARLLADTRGVIDARRRTVSRASLVNWQRQLDARRLETPMDWSSIELRSTQTVREMHKAGVRFLAGTDQGLPLVYPGWSLHDELALLVREIGMTPLEALQSATRNVGEFFNASDLFGTVRAGRVADLVLLDADPLADISNTRKISGVVLRGRYLDRQELAGLIRTAERAARQ
ncbi:MAG: amidohydrolase family protein [Longimicrobiales bacterium]